MTLARRKPRSDALRNRAKLIDAARGILARGGPEASLEAVARQAGVGIGTLYRNFPTREALFLAVYRQEVDDLAELAAAQEAGGENGYDTLRMWLHAMVGLIETKRGLLGALSAVGCEETKAAYAEISKPLEEAVNRLVHRAAAEGSLRPDVSSGDILTSVRALCYAQPAGPDWKVRVLHLTDIFVDGLRAR
ncbi:TetR family transcriptional regulator [Rhodobacterales bacterium HKCCE2091]|nr:TetR family transcriptional regulator [Rhodobacterales bacterium HKCCE2091]